VKERSTEVACGYPERNPKPICYTLDKKGRGVLLQPNFNMVRLVLPVVQRPQGSAEFIELFLVFPSSIPHGAATVVVEALIVEVFIAKGYQRGVLTEWYVNGPLGLEQGFTLAERPAKANGSPLTFELSLSGDLLAVIDSDGNLRATGTAIHTGMIVLPQFAFRRTQWQPTMTSV